MCVRCVCVKGSEDPMRPMVCFCVVQMLLNSTTFLDRFQLGEKASNESDVAAGTLLNIIVFFFYFFFICCFAQFVCAVVPNLALVLMLIG